MVCVWAHHVRQCNPQIPNDKVVRDLASSLMKSINIFLYYMDYKIRTSSLASKLRKTPLPPLFYLFIFLLICSQTIHKSPSLYMPYLKIVLFHAHVNVQGKGVKQIGLKEVGSNATKKTLFLYIYIYMIFLLSSFHSCYHQ